MHPISAEILEILSNRVTKQYGLSAVNQQQHALQAAALAERNGETPAFIVAALVHDIGHMVHDLGEDPAAQDIDDRHEVLGATWLSDRFGPDVTEPVRLHVPAKRYLCATDQAYFGYLSEDSVRSLALQGGPMSADEVKSFEALPFAQAAVRLRRLDEAAKNPRTETPALAHFVQYVDAVLDGSIAVTA
jgi:[1-hydroxy-2-(trimethylamino)ethyl]phosphonate dioxygenase